MPLPEPACASAKTQELLNFFQTRMLGCLPSKPGDPLDCGAADQPHVVTC